MDVLNDRLRDVPGRPAMGSTCPPRIFELLDANAADVVAVVIAWFAILITGRYPRALFDYVVGISRWGLCVQAYAFLLLTDTHPPFSLR